MNRDNFFSESNYIFLPTMKSPKVALAVDNRGVADNAFKLYTPFSHKAKLLKKVSEFYFSNFNGLSKIICGTKKEKKSFFISYLEKKLDRQLISSLYFSTANDKVVMQLQTSNAEIVGYLKYPLNEVGLKHLINEIKAIKLLSEKNVVQSYLLHDEFDGMPFLLLSALDGEIGFVQRGYIDDILLLFKRNYVYKLIDHPRIIQLQKLVVKNSFKNFSLIIDRICENSKIEYALVYEHGDFTPWNIIEVDGKYIPFDFEYFVEDGIEYFDLLKYNYQVGKLLEGRTGTELIKYLQKKIDIPEVLELFQLFLIKEIVQGYKEGESFDVELEILEYLDRL